jgi:hypothetical protein
MLCCPIELKSAKGALHGKQRQWDSNKGIAYQVSRSPETSVAFIRQFKADAAMAARAFSGQALNNKS